MALRHPGVVKRTAAYVDGLRGSPTSRSHALDGDLAAAVARAEHVLESTKPGRKRPSFRLIRSGSSRAFCIDRATSERTAYGVRPAASGT